MTPGYRALSMAKGSIHIKYKKNYRYSMFDAYMRAIKNAADKAIEPIAEFKVLDLGCGRGEFLEYAIAHGVTMIEGIDFDPVCIEMSSKYARCYLQDIENIEEFLEKRSYDLILFSHVLEHMRDPQSILKKAMPFADYFLIAVPNPLRPNVLYYALKKYNYSNLGHYYSWDRSHFTIFIKKCGLNIIDCYIDDVLFPSIPLIGTMRKLRLITALELRVLPYLFPYFSTSLIFLCRKN